MSTYTFNNGCIHLDVSTGHETIAIDGYVAFDRSQSEHKIHSKRYSGYTLSEAICAALIAMSQADNWLEAIDLIERAGIPYRPSE
jgi:hypothetical protein